MEGHKPWSTLKSKMTEEQKKRVDEGVKRMKAEMDREKTITDASNAEVDDKRSDAE